MILARILYKFYFLMTINFRKHSDSQALHRAHMYVQNYEKYNGNENAGAGLKPF